MSTAANLINQIDAQARESVARGLKGLADTASSLAGFRLKQEDVRLNSFITQDNLRWLASDKVQGADPADMDAMLAMHRQEQRDAVASQGFDKMTIARYNNVVAPESFKTGGDFDVAYNKIRNDKVFYAGKAIFDDNLNGIMSNRSYSLEERQNAVKELYKASGVYSMPHEYQSRFTPMDSLLHQAEQMQALVDLENAYDDTQDWSKVLGMVDQSASAHNLNDGEKAALEDEIYAYRDKQDKRTVDRGATLLANLTKVTNEAYANGYKVTPAEAMDEIGDMPDWWRSMYGQSYVDTVGSKYNSALHDEITHALEAGDYDKATQTAEGLYGQAEKAKALAAIALKREAVSGGLSALRDGLGITDFDKLIESCDNIPMENDQGVSRSDVKRYIAFEYAKAGNQKAVQYLNANGSYVPFVAQTVDELTGTKSSSKAKGTSGTVSGQTITLGDGTKESITTPEHVAQVGLEQSGWVWDERLQQKVRYDGIGTMFGTADGWATASRAEIDSVLSDDDYQAKLADLYRRGDLSLAQFNHFASGRSKLSKDPRMSDVYQTISQAAGDLFSDDAAAKCNFIDEAKVAVSNAVAVDPSVLDDPAKLEGLKTTIRSIGTEGAMRSLSDAAAKAVPKAVKDNLGSKSVSGFMRDVTDGKYKLFIDYRIFDKALTDTAFTASDGTEYKGIGPIDWIMSRGNDVDAGKEIENFVVQSIADGAKLDELTPFQQAQVKATSALIAVACAAGRQFRQDFDIRPDQITGIQRVGEGFAFLVDPENHIYARVSDYMSYGDNIPGASYELVLPEMTVNGKGQNVVDFGRILPGNIIPIQDQVNPDVYGKARDAAVKAGTASARLRTTLDSYVSANSGKSRNVATEGGKATVARNDVRNAIMDRDRMQARYAETESALKEQQGRIGRSLAPLQERARRRNEAMIEAADELRRKQAIELSRQRQAAAYNAYKGDNQ